MGDAMDRPLSAPGVSLPEKGWVTDPSPGLYWVRFVRPDGTKTQPAFCVVSPTGPWPKYACWAWTPNLGAAPAHDHDSLINYFVEPLDASTEFFPWTQEISGDGKHKTVRFELVPVDMKPNE